MQDGILFDNVLIASDEKVAESYREKTWKPKYEVEKQKEKEEEEAARLSDGLSGFQKKVFDVLYKVADIPFLEAYKIMIIDLIEKGEKQATLTIGVLVSVAVVILTVFLRMLFAGKRPVASAKPTSETKSTETASETDATAETSAEREENEKEDASATCPRSSRRET